MNVLWYMCAPDGHYPWTPEGSRTVDYGYYRQLAQAYDHLGYTGALFATGAHDVWVLAAALMPFTERMKLLCAVHPGVIAPTLLAKMAATLQEFSGGRAMLNIVSGDAKMMGAYGLTMSHDERYDMADEYLSIYNRVMAGESVTRDGKYFPTVGAKLALPTSAESAPPLWFGGSSDKAIDVAAKHVDTYLSWGETPEQMAQKIEKVKAKAAEYERELNYGIRLYVIVRRTDEEAWAAAADMYDKMDAASIAGNQKFVGNTDSVGQRRMSEMHGGVKPDNLRDLEVAPNIWAGIGLVRPGPGSAIVGSPETVIRTLEEYRKVGIETFILSGMPLLEEAYRFGELVLPKLDLARDETPKRKQFTWNTLFDRDLDAKAS